jgi:hypothetical protein
VHTNISSLVFHWQFFAKNIKSKLQKTWKLSGFSKAFHLPKVIPKNNEIHQIFIF